MHPQPNIEEWRAMEARLMEAIRTQDPVALRGLLTDDFVHRTPAGDEVGCDEFVRAATSLPVTILSLDGEHVAAWGHGDTVVLTGVQVAVTRDGDGAEVTSRGAFTDVFVRRDGAWRLALAYTVDL